ncbi:MAG: hypothetical protein LBG19_08685 [Prevotellaceae bacterium]|jgi:hypothetical protein|nr:hypothetical protein [Prevotellaceae bacterium]
MGRYGSRTGELAFENANKLLAETFIEIGNVEGHPLGSFSSNESGVRDRYIQGYPPYNPGTAGI